MPLREATKQISALTKLGLADEAVNLFKTVIAGETRPTHVTVLCAIRAAAATSSSTTRRAFHAVTVKLGLEDFLPIRTALVPLYSSLQDLNSVVQLYGQTRVNDEILQSAAISAMAKCGGPSAALAVFRRTTKPNAITAIAALSACGFLKDLLSCREIHGYVIRNLYPEINLQNSLINAYGKCGKLTVSLAIFDAMEAKDKVSWSSLMFRFHEYERWRETLILFLRMNRSGAKPGENLVGVTVDACSRIEEFGFLFLLGIHGNVEKVWDASSTLLGTSLLKSYAEFNKLEAARSLFENLIHRDIIAWSAMISIYGKSGFLIEALEIFKRMQEVTIERPNEIMILGLIQACSSAGDARRGRTLHGYSVRRGISANQHIASAMIDLYCKLGMLKQGKNVFFSLESRDMVIWSSMINGYGINSQGEAAIKIYLEMIDQGIKPNGIVFLSLLSSCDHCGLIDEGLNLFQQRENIKLDLSHYTCIVDMLSRHGRAEEALKIIKNMNLKPDARIWAALLAGCRATTGHVAIAEEALRWLSRLDPMNSGSYTVSLSNLYSKLGQWQDAERIRENLGDTVRKTVGFSKSPD